MQQLTLFHEKITPHIVNVASVPQRSPFRYPGGKTWLIPSIRRWLSTYTRETYHLSPLHPTHLVEPFAGGGIVSLTAAAEHLVEQVTMVELDEDVAAVWQALLQSSNWQWITHMLKTFELTYEQVQAFLGKTDLTLEEHAFKTLLRNRVNRGGILAPGAGLVKNGENGRGLRSRWYPETLKKRIEHIIELRDRITFLHEDGLNILQKYAQDTNTAFFIDPPYTVAGKKAGQRLYKYADVNHEKLFELVSTIQGDFLMTYDDTQEVRALAQKYGFQVQAIPMKNTHHAKMYELLICKNVDWL